MKVLFVAQFLGGGGVEMMIRNRWLALRSRGVRVEALFLYGDDRQGELCDRTDVTAEPSQIAERVRAADVVCAIDTPQVFRTLDEAGTPVIVETHSAYEHQRGYLQRPLPARTRCVLAPTRAFASRTERELRDRRVAVRAIPNPLDPLLFDESPRPRRAPRAVAWVGRFDRLKNWRAAVDIFAHVRRGTGSSPDLELSLYGYRAGREPVIDVLRSAGVLGATRIWPSIDREAMALHHRAIAAAGGVHLSTSEHESFGMAIAEAMAAGAPCVVPRLPELVEVTGGHAAYFEPGASGDAAREIDRLLDDPTHRATMTAALRERAREFHPDRVGPTLLRTLEEACT